MKEYFSFPKTPEEDPHHQMQFSHIQYPSSIGPIDRTLMEGTTPN